MACAKLKCVQCENRFPREQMEKVNRISSVCGLDCKVEWATGKGKKAVKEQTAKIYGPNRVKTKALSPIKTRKNELKKACHLYVRTRDKGDPCICCGLPLGENYHAGHYLESGNNPKIRYDEDNIHAQRLDCNNFKGGDSGFYRVNLIKKIGLDRVLRLESMKGGTVKRTCEDYKEIEMYFKEKIKTINHKG